MTSIRWPALALCVTALLSGCGQPPPPTAAGEEPAPVLELPGTFSRPDSAGFIPVSTDSLAGVLLYVWIPLENCDHNDPDLVFLASLAGGTILPVPLQFDLAGRNAAQLRVNSLGLPLSVYLGDGNLLAYMNIDVLPAAVLVLPGGAVSRADGMGCAQRALRGSP